METPPPIFTRLLSGQSARLPCERLNPATAYLLQQIKPIGFGRTEQAQVNKYRVPYMLCCAAAIAFADVGLWCFLRPSAGCAGQAFSISITLAGRSGILRIGFPVASNTADAMAEAASAFAASEPWPY
jgi:hypothetical protein